MTPLPAVVRLQTTAFELVAGVYEILISIAVGLDIYSCSISREGKAPRTAFSMFLSWLLQTVIELMTDAFVVQIGPKKPYNAGLADVMKRRGPTALMLGTGLLNLMMPTREPLSYRWGYAYLGGECVMVEPLKESGKLGFGLVAP